MELCVRDRERGGLPFEANRGYRMHSIGVVISKESGAPSGVLCLA